MDDLFSVVAPVAPDQPARADQGCAAAGGGHREHGTADGDGGAHAPVGGFRRWSSEAAWRADVERDAAERLAYEARYVIALTDSERAEYLLLVSQKRSATAYARLQKAIQVEQIKSGDKR